MGFEIMRGFNADDIEVDLASDGEPDAQRTTFRDTNAPTSARPESIDLTFAMHGSDGSISIDGAGSYVVELEDLAE